jgi:hypothetical protein
LPKSLTDEVNEENRAKEIRDLREMGADKTAEELEAHRKNNPPSNYVTKEQTRAAI